MPLRIPRERRDAVPGAHAYRMERPRHRARAFVKRGIADPGNASVRPGRYGFGIGVPFGGVGKEFVERQAIGLHRTVDHWHPADFGGSGGEITPTFQLRSETHTSELQSLMSISYAVFISKKKHIDDTRTKPK